MASSSVAHVHRLAATDLTGTFVYSTSIPIGSMSDHSLLAVYDPDENDGILHIDWQISPQDKNTADASSDWISVGTTTTSTGVRTFTSDVWKLTAAAAGTKLSGHWDVDGVHAYKMRVGVKETFSGAGSNFGNALITSFSKSN